MKKNGILNSEISKILSDMGHTDQLIIADCGLPVPDGVKKIDLSISEGIPSFEELLNLMMNEMKIEKAILAEEIKGKNSNLNKRTVEKLKSSDIEVVYIQHEEFKKQSQFSKTIIRTGEATPYANVILQSGVLF